MRFLSSLIGLVGKISARYHGNHFPANFLQLTYTDLCTYPVGVSSTCWSPTEISGFCYDLVIIFFFFYEKNLLSCPVIEHSNEIKMPLRRNVRLKGLLNVSKFNWAYQQSYFSKKICTKMLLHFNVAKWFINSSIMHFLSSLHSQKSNFKHFLTRLVLYSKLRFNYQV